MLVKDAIFNVIDTETTGVNPKEDKVVSIASVRCSLEKGIISKYGVLVNPGRDIPAEASAIHHIVAKHVENAGPLEWALPSTFPPEECCIVAHNAEFDKAFIKPLLPTAPWLCTLRLARHLWPEAPKHSNQFLRYHLGLECPEVDGLPAHEALPDAIVTAHLLLHQLGVLLGKAKDPSSVTTEALIEWANSPVLLTTCRFGNKHFGQKWADVPKSYLQWMEKTCTELDSDVRFTMSYYLGNGSRS